METNTMTIDAVMKAAQLASQQNDRYLFVALLLITGIAIAILAKWLANQYNKMLSQWRDDMNTRESTIRTLHDDRVKASERYAEELRVIVQNMAAETRLTSDRYATVMTENGKTMGQIAHALGELQHSCAMARSTLPAHLRPQQPQPQPFAQA